MKIFLAMVVACTPFAITGCSKTCSDAEVASDTSSATYSASNSLVGNQGPGSAQSRGTVMGLAPSAESQTTLQLIGYVGSNGSFTITIPNVQSSGSAALDPTSAVCLSGGVSDGSCSTLTGTIDVASFSIDCESGACALSVVATLKGSAAVSGGGSFSIDASLNHYETLGSYACGGFAMAE